MYILYSAIMGGAAGLLFSVSRRETDASLRGLGYFLSGGLLVLALLAGVFVK